MNLFATFYGRDGPGIAKDAPKRRGLALLGEIVAREWWELIKLNLLFVLSALPLITLPAALFAMARVTVAMVEDRNVWLWSDYWQAFRTGFRRATLPVVLLAALGGMATLCLQFYSALAVTNLIFAAPLGITLLVLVALPMVTAAVLVTLAMDDRPVCKLLKPALVGLIVKPLPPLLAAGVIAALWLVHVAYYPVSILMPALLNFSFGALLATFCARKGAALGLSLLDQRQGQQPQTTGAAKRAENLEETEDDCQTYA